MKLTPAINSGGLIANPFRDVRSRTSRVLVCLAVLAISCDKRATPIAPRPQVTEYRNGRWFDGTTFAARSMYVERAELHDRADHVDEVVDLHGGFVVPPFGDAHQHFLEPGQIHAYIDRFLDAGIFYVRDQANAPVIRDQIDRYLNRPESVDLISANQGWTGSGGHPIEIMMQGEQFGATPPGWLADHLDGGAVMVVDTPGDVAREWPMFVAGHPDFVKVFLFASEHYKERRNDPAWMYRRGIDPALVPDIVARAHAAGLQVSAPVETAAD